MGRRGARVRTVEAVQDKVMQRDIFLNGEGDEWYRRNKGHPRHGYEVYLKYIKQNYKVLEIGCSDGANLDLFHSQTGCACYGIDPSEQATSRTGHFLSQGTAENLPYPDSHFDFVLFGFCLYLADRVHLPRIVAEADRVLKGVGYLGITDFDVKFPETREYHHKKGVFSYKYDYPSLWLSFPQYSLVERVNVGDYASTVLHKNCTSWQTTGGAKGESQC